MTLGVVGDGVRIGPDVGEEFIDAPAECLDARVGGSEILEVVAETANAGQGRSVIAVPQVPLDAFQFPFSVLRFVFVMMGEAFGILSQHGEPHGDMEPVEHVLGTGGHIRSQAPDSVAAIGQERNLLVHLQSLFAQNLVQAPLRLFVEALDETEVAVVPSLGDGLADHDLEILLSPRAAGLTGADIPAVNSDDDRPLGQWQLGTVLRRALDEEGTLLPKLSFHAGGDTVQVVAHRFRVEGGPDGKDVLEQFHRDAEWNERGPFRLQIQHLGRDVFAEQSHQGAEAFACGGFAAAALQSWGGHRDITERRTESERGSALAPQTFAACAAASMVSQERRGLGANDALLNAAQQLLGLGERQTDLLQLVMGLVEHHKLLVTEATVARINPQRGKPEQRRPLLHDGFHAWIGVKGKSVCFPEHKA